jgi:hypothetical protein
VFGPEPVDFLANTRLNLRKYVQSETGTKVLCGLVKPIKHILLHPQKLQGLLPI